jgi:hypothetical protein
MSVLLPVAQVGRFPALFSWLETAQQDMGITHYGVSLTTLEDIFLALGSEGDATFASVAPGGGNADDSKAGDVAADADGGVDVNVRAQVRRVVVSSRRGDGARSPRPAAAAVWRAQQRRGLRAADGK